MMEKPGYVIIEIIEHSETGTNETKAKCACTLYKETKNEYAFASELTFEICALPKAEFTDRERARCSLANVA